MNHRLTTTLFLLVSISLMITACAHLTANSKSEEALMQKVQIEWNAKVKKDWGTVYDLAVDAYKNKVNRGSFVRGANINVQNFSIKEVKILEPGSKALAVVECKISQMGFNFNITAKEEWLWENGAWHLNLLPTLRTPFDKKK